MIHIDAFELQDIATGRFFATRYLGCLGPSRYAPSWLEDMPRDGSQTKEQSLERLLADFEGKPDVDRNLWHVRIPVIMVFDWSEADGRRRWKSADPGFYEMFVRKVRRPACECCGANPYRFDMKPRRALHEVADGTWRCEKHVGRNPCAIEGCGKTRANRHPSSDDHLCGTHWKMTPYRFKAIYRRIWREAKRNVRKHIGDRQGFTEQLNARYWRNWHRVIRETRLAVHSPATAADILPSSGPPPAALVAELTRLGL